MIESGVMWMLMTKPKLRLNRYSSGFFPPSSVDSPLPAESTSFMAASRSMVFFTVVLLSVTA